MPRNRVIPGLAPRAAIAAKDAEMHDPDLRGELQQARQHTDALFALVAEATLYERPIADRHRLVFYLGHLDAFDWNQVARSALDAPSFHPGFDRLFEAGIDPPPGQAPAGPPVRLATCRRSACLCPVRTGTAGRPLEPRADRASPRRHRASMDARRDAVLPAASVAARVEARARRAGSDGRHALASTRLRSDSGGPCDARPARRPVRLGQRVPCLRGGDARVRDRPPQGDQRAVSAVRPRRRRAAAVLASNARAAGGCGGCSTTFRCRPRRRST